MNIFEEYEKELLTKDAEMVTSGEWGKRIQAMREKSKAEMARMAANGAIELGEEEESEE